MGNVVNSNEDDVDKWAKAENDRQSRIAKEIQRQETEELASHLDTQASEKQSKRARVKTFKGKGEETVTNLILQRKAKLEDFDIEKYIGQGAYGRVMKVKHKKNGQIYAMKMLEKSYIKKHDQILNTFTERGILVQLNHPFIVSLQFAFQSGQRLYFVMDYCSGGDFFGFLRIKKRFTERETRFYAGEIALALECLHRHKIVYRDLKPENMLLDQTGHVKMTDFGLSKNLGKDDSMKTFCGSTTYLAPEVIVHELREKGYTKAVDWWSFGVMFYEMLTGLPAFYDRNTQLNYVKIMYASIPMHKRFSRECRSLIFDLLEKDPKDRLSDAKGVKEHPFFAEMNWSDLLKMKVKPPLVPTWEAPEEGNLQEVLEDLQMDDTNIQADDPFRNFSFVRQPQTMEQKQQQGLGDDFYD